MNSLKRILPYASSCIFTLSNSDGPARMALPAGTNIVHTGPPAKCNFAMPEQYRKQRVRHYVADFAMGTFGDLIVRRYRLTITCEDCKAWADSGSDNPDGFRLRTIMLRRADERWNRKFRCPWCGGIMRANAAHEDSFKRERWK